MQETPQQTLTLDVRDLEELLTQAAKCGAERALPPGRQRSRC